MQASNSETATYRALVKLIQIIKNNYCTIIIYIQSYARISIDIRTSKYDIASKVFKQCQENGNIN